jgi:2-polyprenyl-3-methyl-5-hydroxy-6-metoxy-1,4-benzoquinol methylase
MNETGSPFPETADIETSNDDYATRFRGATGAWMLEVQERAVSKLLGARVERGATVLDVGGGHGQLAHPLADAGYQVTVIGSAPSCRHRIADLVDAGRCSFEVGNVVALPYPDKSFDAVVAVRMLTHCSVWPTLVKEMCRVSRGPVITDYPTSQSLNAIAPMLFDAKKKFEKNTRTWTLFRHRQVREAFAAAGFRPTGRVGQFFLPMVVHRALKCKPLSAFLEGVCRLLGLSRLWGTPVVGRWERPAT